jgi:hypothetical protein
MLFGSFRASIKMVRDAPSYCQSGSLLTAHFERNEAYL